ncbi:hypothetical protein JB92DRAFT_2847987, partial [Gautieria morchelliformis]
PTSGIAATEGAALQSITCFADEFVSLFQTSSAWMLTHISPRPPGVTTARRVQSPAPSPFPKARSR